MEIRRASKMMNYPEPGQMKDKEQLLPMVDCYRRKSLRGFFRGIRIRQQHTIQL